MQAAQSDTTVGLNQVGFTNVEKLVKLGPEGDRPIVLMANFEVFVDLPSWRKGVDMSRNMEVIDETLEAAVAEPAYRVEDVCGNAAERLLKKHDYTSKAEVKMEAEFVTCEYTPESHNETQQTATVIAGACATEDGTTEEIGARVTGMTVCPCSQGMSNSRARETLRDLDVNDDIIDQLLERVPQAGHSQRGHATLTIQSDGAPEVDLNNLIDVARDAMSARIYNLAKRPDEDHMTEAAHENAKFVEDCVRDMAEGVVREFPDLAGDAVVTMKQSNDESIHQHDAHAERAAQVGQLREELGGAGVPADD